MARLNWARLENRLPHVPKDNRRDAYERRQIAKVLRQREAYKALQPRWAREVA